MNPADAVERLARLGALVGEERLGTAGAGAGVYRHHNPATGRLQAEVPLAGPAEVDRAVAAARAALPGWRATPLEERVRVLHRLAELLAAADGEAAALNALDNGTPVSVLRPGAYTATWTRYYAGWVDKLDGRVVPLYGSDGLDYVLPEPYGVVAAIPPWNGSMMGMGHKAVPAVAAGNTVVAKPPEIAPFGALRFAELALEAGLPPGVVNVVPGAAEAGEALVRHPGVDKISFTGGTATARRIMAAAADALTPVVFELGGKSANIVFPDADLDLAVPVAGLLGAVMLSGQGCALPTRLYVHDDVHDEFVERIVARVESVTIGDPLEPTTLMGPVVNEAACTRVMGVIERALSSGAGRLVTGGRRLERDGWFVAPTVFDGVDQSSDLARSEVFGPVLAVQRFRTEEEAVALANDSPFGLAAYVHTRDVGRAHRLARALEAGTVWVNQMPVLSPTAPFGGYKDSGFGREGGRAGIEEFVRQKNVVIGL